MNFADLASKLDNLATAGATRRTSEAAIEAALRLLKYLVFRTPVDTSRAMSNWQVGVGAPPVAEIEPYFPGSFGSTRPQSGSEALRVGKERLRQKQPGQLIYVSNLTPYIKDLNDGTSRQAPRGFVERGVRYVQKGGR